MNKEKLFKIFLSLGLVLGISSSAAAKEVLLNKTEFLFQGNKSRAELWGHRVKYGYAKDLTLLLKREDGSIITAYKPDVQGGYSFGLESVQLIKKDNPTQQLMLSLKQGDWQTYSEYRILDPSNPKAIKEIFDGGDSFGIVLGAELDGDTVKVQTVKDSNPLNVSLNPKILEYVAENRKQVSLNRLESLTCIDIDKDGVDELVSNQTLTVDNRLIADVGAVWHFVPEKEEKKIKSVEKSDANAEEKKEKKTDKSARSAIKDLIELINQELKDEPEEDKVASVDSSKVKNKESRWIHDHVTIMKCETINRKNTINDGAFFRGGMVYPVKMVARGGEATYPQVMLNDNFEVEKALNKLLWEESEPFIRDYLQGKVDLAYNVIRADKKLLTIQLIFGKDTFAHHNINIIPGEKKKLELKEVLDTKSKDLVELLNVLNNNSKISWDMKLTDEWYMREDNLYLMKNINGIDEVSGYDINNLKKYIKDSRFLSDQEEKKTKSEEKK